MEKIPSIDETTPEKKFDIVEFLGDLETVTEEDIKKFKEERIVNCFQSQFNKASSNIQKTLIVLDKLPPEKLKILIKIAQGKDFLTGIHSVSDKLQMAYLWTEDPKYQFNKNHID